MIPLILLHGALGAAAQMTPLRDLLSGTRTILTPDFAGHGYSTQAAASFSIQNFAADIIRLMDENGQRQVDVFGYSMGGFVGMYLAQEHPQRIRRIATLGTKYFWSPAYAAAQQKMLDADIIAQKVPAYATALANRHTGKDWTSILQKTAAMMMKLGEEQPLLAWPSGIQQPALLMVGDRDNTVTPAETTEAMNGLKHGQLAVLPGTPHPLEKTDLHLLHVLLENFLA